MDTKTHPDKIEEHVIFCNSAVLLHYFTKWVESLPQQIQNLGGSYLPVMKACQQVVKQVQKKERIPCGTVHARKLVNIRQLHEHLQITCKIVKRDNKLFIQLQIIEEFYLGHVIRKNLDPVHWQLCEVSKYQEDVVDKIIKKCSFKPALIVSSSFSFLVKGHSHTLSKLHYFHDEKTRTISIYSLRPLPKLTSQLPGARIGSVDEISDGCAQGAVDSFEVIKHKEFVEDSIEEAYITLDELGSTPTRLSSFVSMEPTDLAQGRSTPIECSVEGRECTGGAQGEHSSVPDSSYFEDGGF